MARLLMNMILIKHGYTVSLIRQENRDDYLNHLEKADKTEDLTEFINYVANSCEYALNLHLRAVHGESIEGMDDIDKEVALFKRASREH
jgi:Fic family protein